LSIDRPADRLAAAAPAEVAVRAELGRILAASPVRAGTFIVTLYGDVAAPWGGVLWIGNVIGICAEVGISETLVRTAVSRLVGSDLLEGERVGRRSYYRLTGPAARDFAAAAAVLFGPAAAGEPDWLIVCIPEAGADLAPRGPTQFGRLAPGVAIAPWRRDAPPPESLPAGAVTFRAPAVAQPGLAALAATWWPLADCAEAYRAFIARFDPLARLLDAGLPSDLTCLAARLLLVHHYRAVALRDPRLPAAALPPGWPRAPARRLFAALYRRLAPPADREVARRFVDPRGSLRADGDTMQARLAALADFEADASESG
jgi:phenylacetic acid degradation operon negative regulatory protein